MRPAIAQDKVQMYECIVHKKLLGREEGPMDAPEAKWPEGRLREVEKGDPGYTGIAKGKPIPEWIGLFGALHGYGSSFLSLYLSKDFRCKKTAAE